MVLPRRRDDYAVRLERAAIARSLENLMTFPYIADAVRGGTLGLCGAWFDIATGQVLVRTSTGYVDAGQLPIREANSQKAVADL